MGAPRRWLQAVAWRLRVGVDQLRGLDFLSVTEPGDVGLDPKAAYRSSPSGGRHLAAVLQALNVQSGDSIVDVGCGKGSAMRTMLRFPFAHVDGIEVSSSLATTAERNFRRLGSQKTRLFVCDAAEFGEFDRYNFIYFYNPFPCTTMEKVLMSIRQSVLRVDRDLAIIYANPTCHDAVLLAGFHYLGGLPDRWGNEIAVYSNRSRGLARFRAPAG